MAQQNGLMSIAATHLQARHALPTAAPEFRAQFSNVKLHLHQGSPKQVAEMRLSSEVDVGIAIEALNNYSELVALPCYCWTHSVLVSPGHPLLDSPLTLQNLAQFELIIYATGFTGRSHIDEAFTEQQLAPNVVLTAMDAGALLGSNLTKLAVRRGSCLRGYVYAFIESFAPTLNRAVVAQMLSDAPGSGPDEV